MPAPNCFLISSPAPTSHFRPLWPPAIGAVRRALGSPSRAHPRNPAAGSGAGGAAGAGEAGRGAGRPPGGHGAHSGSEAAAIWAASPCPAGSGRVWTLYSLGARPPSATVPTAGGPGSQAQPFPSGCPRALQLEAHAGRSAQGP